MAFDYAKLSRPKQRAIVLVRTRNLKMARNAHAYVRGSTVKFYEWLEGGQEAARGAVGMDLRRLPSRKSGTSRRRRRPRRRSNSRSRSDRHWKSRPRPGAAGVVVGVGGPRIGSAGRDHRQDARRNDERLRSGAGRTVRRPNGKEPPAETDPRGSRPRGSPQVAATG